jgi:hypothetical protein
MEIFNSYSFMLGMATGYLSIVIGCGIAYIFFVKKG